MIGVLGSCLMQHPSQVLSARFDHAKSWVGISESLAVTARVAKPARQPA